MAGPYILVQQKVSTKWVPANTFLFSSRTCYKFSGLSLYLRFATRSIIMTKRIIPAFLLLAVLTIVFASCKKETDNEQYYSEATRGYYPLQLGRWVDYDVDSIIWNDFGGVGQKRTKSLKMRYTVVDTFTDLAGRPSYRIDILQRNADTAIWQVSTVIEATPTTSGLEIIQNNLRQEKLIFPVSEQLTWYGNRAIDTNETENMFYAGWIYQYVNFLKPYNNGRVNYDNTVTVNQINDSLNNPDTNPNAYAERTFSREVYGYNVGMVYREFTHWTYDPSIPANAYRKGFQVIMRATDSN